ncbi:MAG TPA: amino acid adenylation domain-containing protein, partial [Steroidobacteraceae bacterium]|nr:amino acid adenylation domain-containing protein [Steroidobacteraceae bacterium]
LMLEDARPSRLLGTAATTPRLQELACPHIVLDEPEVIVRLQQHPAGNPVDQQRARRLRPESPAYLIYTSGSTGKPKGALNTHAAIVNRLCWMQDEYQLEEDDRVLQKTPFGFDVSVWEFFWPLVQGATLVIAPPGAHQDPRALATIIQEEQITTIHFVPSMLAAFLQEPLAASCRELRRVICSGEALPTPLQMQFHSVLPDVPLHNLYGPTEAAIDVSYWHCRNTARAVPHGGTLPDTGTAPIGRAIWNTQLYVLDAHLQLLPTAAAGELYIAGAGLARGYLQRPGLSAERFIPDPFGKPGTRMYRTGDLARRRSDGVLEFLGRSDSQVKLRGLRIELGEIEAALLAHPDVAQAAVIVREDQPGEKHLVGYVTAASGRSPDPASLRRALGSSLPDYMVPIAVLVLDRLPISPHGKLDRKRLPAPEFESVATAHAPRTPHEEILCTLFAETLGVSRVGIHDSFFELGGDSIMAIRLVSSARRHGLALSTRDIFKHRAVEALANICSPLLPMAATVSQDTVGEVIPTPLMGRLLESGAPARRFSQSMFLIVPDNLEHETLLEGLRTVLDHHDALRLRVEDGKLWGIPRGGVSAEACFRVVDRRTASLAEERQAAESRLDPQGGVLLQAVWFYPGRLLLTIHHVAVDAVSWHILSADLAAACAAKHMPLPANGTSFQHWTQLLSLEAHRSQRVQELDYWTSVLSKPAAPLFRGKPDPERDTAGSARHLRLTLAAAVTEPLLSVAPVAFRARINDVLLTAFALAVSAWHRRRGQTENGAVTLDLEGHGREDIFEGVDLSRTVGWFTSTYPVHLDVGSLVPSRAVKLVKEHLRKLPDNGLGYGLLRHLNPRTAAVLGSLPAPPICLNYLGRFVAARSADWSAAPEVDALTAGCDPQMPRAYALEVNALTVDGTGGPQLTADWSWCPALISEADVQELAEGWFASLESLVREAAQLPTGGLTPADLPLVSLTHSEIEHLEQRHGNIDDILPLSPLQEGLLFHTVYDRQASDLYTVQLILEMAGGMRAEALQARAQQLIRRHANLRAAFEHEGLGGPVQVIAREVTTPWRHIDLSTLDEAERSRRWSQLLAEDRAARFDPTSAPLLRFTLVRLAPERHRLIFTHHHLLLDGWSIPILINELLTADELPRVKPYRDYLTWLATRDSSAAERAWRDALAGLEEPTRLATQSADTGVFPETITLEVSQSVTSDVVRAARAHGLTLNTVVQGAWAILLARLTGRNDVVFGTTVAGRPPEIAGSDRMVGLFINTLPVRVTLSPQESALEVLTRIQERQSSLTAHEHLGLAHIQHIAALGELFDTLVVLENYPYDRRALQSPQLGLRVSSVEHRDVTHYPLCLAILPGERLHLRLQYRPDLFTRETAEGICKRLVGVVGDITADPSRLVARIDLLDAQERHRILIEWNGAARAVE